MRDRRTKNPSWRMDLLDSLQPRAEGGIYDEGARRMGAELNGQPVRVTVTRRCRTVIFRFPGVARQLTDCHMLYSCHRSRVGIASDLLGYFDALPSGDSQYSIDASLRHDVSRVCEAAIDSSGESAPLFLVIEHSTSFPPVTFGDHQAYLVDEHQDGSPIIGGGREGEQSILAIRTAGSPWPDREPLGRIPSLAITAVRAEQNSTRPLEKLCDASCFVSDQGNAVYPCSPSLSGELSVLPAVSAGELQEKTDRLRTRLGGMAADTTPVAAELFDSMVLDEDLVTPAYAVVSSPVAGLGRSQRSSKSTPAAEREDVIARATSPRE